MDIEGYKIHRKIGEGAMAGVFLADQVSLGRPVALKILATELAGQQGFTERFLKEGRIIAYLKHPQIVNVYDLGTCHHHYYLAMELLSGGTLEQKIEQGESPGQSVRFLIKICQALGYAHDNGVIHRDIKSQNIMFRSDNIPVLTDFGIARLMDNDPQLTIPGRTIGSPLYMSPEQICGHTIDPRADLYSVGILLYKMLTNKMPYYSDKILTIAMMHKTAPIPVLPKDLSRFQPVLNKLLAKEPEQRYPSAQELIEALIPFESENEDLSISSHQEPYQTQQTDPFPDGEQMNMPVAGHLSATDMATQPMVESRDEIRASKQGNHGEAGGHVSSDDKVPPLGDGEPILPKDKSMGKIGFILGGALSLLTAGVFAFYFHFQPMAESRQPPSAGVQGVPADTVRGHALTADKQPSFHSVRPPEEFPEESPVKTSRDPSSVDQKVEALMAKAESQLNKYNLTRPAGDNCYETYQQLLSLDPSGQRAESVLMRIGQAYRRLALAAQTKGSLHQSLAHVAKGLSLSPKDSALIAMQDELRTKMAEQERIKQEQARKLEKQIITRAAELASMAKRRKVERQQEVHRRPEAGHEQSEPLKVDPEIPEPQKVKIEVEPVEPSESAVEPPDKKKRLFGTF